MAGDLVHSSKMMYIPAEGTPRAKQNATLATLEKVAVVQRHAHSKKVQEIGVRVVPCLNQELPQLEAEWLARYDRKN